MYRNWKLAVPRIWLAFLAMASSAATAPLLDNAWQRLRFVQPCVQNGNSLSACWCTFNALPELPSFYRSVATSWARNDAATYTTGRTDGMNVFATPRQCRFRGGGRSMLSTVPRANTSWRSSAAEIVYAPVFRFTGWLGSTIRSDERP